MNLGIYNERHMYNENMYNEHMELNKHIEQGVQFKDYGKKYTRENEHKLLEYSSSPHWGSIVEALTSTDSTQQPASASTSQLSAEQEKLNKLISEYSTLYKTYTSTMINKPSTDADRIKMEAELAAKQKALVDDRLKIKAEVEAQNNALIAMSRKINDEYVINQSKKAKINTMMAANQSQLSDNLNKLAEQQKNLAAATGKYDQNTISGAIETTTLSMTSMYYHYLVYFIISLTLIAFTFNILVNPNANVVNAIIVVSTIVVIYIIARHYTIPL
jgi:hypothetical protein